MKTTALLLPGIGNSDSNHWQSHWEKTHASFLRIHQRDWENPDCEEWVGALEHTLSRLDTAVVIVAHSLSCLLVPHWTEISQHKIQGAMLVAPPDPDGPNFPKQAQGFSPLPLKPLPFPSIVVASRDDPYAGLEFAKYSANAWGSEFINIGSAGHINSSSRLGKWDEGFTILKRLF
jgi:uncharacterized protein